MNKIHNMMNKVILGAGILGTLYLNSCVRVENNTQGHRAKSEQNKHYIINTDGLVTVENNPQTGLIAYTGLAKDECGCNESEHIQLDPIQMIWNNAKLIGKDNGFVSYQLGNARLNYTFSEFLFQGPEGKEVSLFGKEGTFYVGQNYDIQFYKLKPNQKVSSTMVLDAFRVKHDGNWVYVNNNNLDNDLEGLLNSSSRVKK